MDEQNPLEPFTDPADEARIVALILGEASDYERAQLEEAIAEDPALKSLHRRLSSVDSLLASSESEQTDAGWKLPDERRAAVLDRIRSVPGAGADQPGGDGGTSDREPVPWRKLLAAAAVFTFASTIALQFTADERKAEMVEGVKSFNVAKERRLVSSAGGFDSGAFPAPRSEPGKPGGEDREDLAWATASSGGEREFTGGARSLSGFDYRDVGRGTETLPPALSWAREENGNKLGEVSDYRRGQPRNDTRSRTDHLVAGVQPREPRVTTATATAPAGPEPTPEPDPEPAADPANFADGLSTPVAGRLFRSNEQDAKVRFGRTETFEWRYDGEPGSGAAPEDRPAPVDPGKFDEIYGGVALSATFGEEGKAPARYREDVASYFKSLSKVVGEKSNQDVTGLGSDVRAGYDGTYQFRGFDLNDDALWADKSAFGGKAGGAGFGGGGAAGNLPSGEAGFIQPPGTPIPPAQGESSVVENKKRPTGADVIDGVEVDRLSLLGATERPPGRRPAGEVTKEEKPEELDLVPGDRSTRDSGSDPFASDAPVEKAADGKEVGAAEATEVAQREMTRRLSLLSEAQKELSVAGKLKEAGDLQAAQETYREALEKIPDAPLTSEKLEQVEQKLAETTLQLADQLAREGRRDEARELAESVISGERTANTRGEQRKDKAKKMLERLDDPEWYNHALTPDHVDNVAEVERQLKVAQGYFDLGDFESAERSYESALRLDRYNSSARRGKQQVEEARKNYVGDARDHTRSGLLRQVDEAWETRVPLFDVTEGEPQAGGDDPFGYDPVGGRGLAQQGQGEGQGQAQGSGQQAGAARYENGFGKIQAKGEKESELLRRSEDIASPDLGGEPLDGRANVTGFARWAGEADAPPADDAFREYDRHRLSTGFSVTFGDEADDADKSTPKWLRDGGGNENGTLAVGGGAATEAGLVEAELEELEERNGEVFSVTGGTKTRGRHWLKDKDEETAMPASIAMSGTLTPSDIDLDGDGDVGGRERVRTKRKLKETIIPSLNLENATVDEALAVLNRASNSHDAYDAEGGANGIVILNDGYERDEEELGEAPTISLKLENVPLDEALRYVAESAGMKYRVGADEVRLTPQWASAQDLVTQSFAVPADFLTKAHIAAAEAASTNDPFMAAKLTEDAAKGRSSAKSILEAQGITFPEGASVFYNPSNSTLVVRNTSSNLGLVKDLVAVQKTDPEPLSQEALDLEKLTSEAPFSTFSLNVSDVSFKLAMAALLESGSWPDAVKIRPEEFLNSFDYGDPMPSLEDRVACAVEQCAHPFLQQRNLVRISMRTAAAGRAAGTPLRLTVLLDKSGSMEKAEREQSVIAAFEALTSLLGEGDQVTVVGFARTPRLIADRIDGTEGAKLMKLVAAAPSEGGTNIEEALRLARQAAERQFLDGAQNRIVLITDGAANLGDAEPDSLQQQVIALRGAGIAFDACGVGAEDFNDEILEALARKGDGRYYFLDKPEDADASFVRQLAGALRPAAKNVKVQVKFNPDRVERYRLSGFEKHRLKKEDFRNDKVDAAEMAAAEAGGALYQVQVNPEGQGPIGEVFVRFQDTASGEMVERSWTIDYQPSAPRLAEAAPSMQLAATASLFAEKLKGGPAGDLVDLDQLVPVATALRAGAFESHERVAQLAEMIQAARRMQN